MKNNSQRFIHTLGWITIALLVVLTAMTAGCAGNPQAAHDRAMARELISQCQAAGMKAFLKDAPARHPRDVQCITRAEYERYIAGIKREQQRQQSSYQTPYSPR